MLFTGLFLIANCESFAGVFPIASGLIIVTLGATIWGLRARISVNVGLIILLAVTLFIASIAIVTTTKFASPDLLARMKWPTNPIPVVAFLILVLGGGIWTNYLQLVRAKQEQDEG